MTLKELLDSYEKSDFIKIGAIDASSFFFVGTVQQFYDGVEVFCAYNKEIYEKELQSVMKSSKTTAKEKAKAQADFDNTHKALLERTVVEHFPADPRVEIDAVEVILIEGRERGGYWMLCEGKDQHFTAYKARDIEVRKLRTEAKRKERQATRRCCNNCAHKNEIDNRDRCEHSGRRIKSMNNTTSCAYFSTKKWSI